MSKGTAEKERQRLAFKKFKDLPDKAFTLLFHMMRDLDISRQFDTSNVHLAYKCCIEMGCDPPEKGHKVHIIHMIVHECAKDPDGFMADLLRYHLQWSHTKKVEWDDVEWKKELLDLLAVIHSDGGHFVHDNGLEKALEVGKEYIQYVKRLQSELFSHIRQLDPNEMTNLAFIEGVDPYKIIHKLITLVSGNAKVNIEGEVDEG